MIIAFASQCDTSGRGALACNLAVLRARGGRKVCIVDVGAGSRCLQWCLQRGAAGASPWIAGRRAGCHGLKHELRNLARQFDDVLVNVDGCAGHASRYALAAADLVVIPADPARLDLASQYALLAWLNPIRRFNPRLRIILVTACGAAAPAADGSAAMRAFCNRVPAATLAGTTIHGLSAYEYGDGRCVSDAETCDPDRAADMHALYREVYRRPEPDSPAPLGRAA